MEKAKLIQTNVVFLTYPQTGEVNKEEVANLLSSFEPKWYIIGRERHNETEGYHMHVLMKLGKKLRIAASNFAAHFDLIIGEKKYHGEYKAVLNRKLDLVKLIQYICTADGCDTNPLCFNIKWEQYLKNERNHKKCFGLDTIKRKGLKRCIEEGDIPLDKVHNVMKGLSIYDNLEKPKYTKKCKGLWLWGDAGKGKSTFVKKMSEEYSSNGLYAKNINKWWDGYQGEEVVVMDDPSLSKMRLLLDHVKNWADQSPSRVEFKGGQMWSRHKWFVITTNWNPRLICEQTITENHTYYSGVRGGGNVKAEQRVVFDEVGWAAIQRRFIIKHISNDDYRTSLVTFNPNLLPDNEFCDLNDLVPEIDNKARWDEFIANYPEYNTLDNDELWVAFADFCAGNLKPPTKRDPILDWAGSGYY